MHASRAFELGYLPGLVFQLLFLEPSSLSRSRCTASRPQQRHSNAHFPNGLQDLTSGTVAGVAQLLVGHPFDTIKVRPGQSSWPGVAAAQWWCYYSPALKATFQA